ALVLQDRSVEFRIPQNINHLALSIIIHAGKAKGCQLVAGGALVLHEPTSSTDADEVSALWRCRHWPPAPQSLAGAWNTPALHRYYVILPDLERLNARAWPNRVSREAKSSQCSWLTRFILIALWSFGRSVRHFASGSPRTLENRAHLHRRPSATARCRNTARGQ